MKEWTEADIIIVFYVGILVAGLAAITAIGYSRISLIVEKIGGRKTFWSAGFRTSVILSGFLGSMSVVLKDCDGNYPSYASDPVKMGLVQVSTGLHMTAQAIGIWLWVFGILLLLRKRLRKPPLIIIAISLIIILFGLSLLEKAGQF